MKFFLKRNELFKAIKVRMNTWKVMKEGYEK